MGRIHKDDKPFWHTNERPTIQLRRRNCPELNYQHISWVLQCRPKRNLTEPDIRDFWEVRHRLSNDRGLVLMDRRIVIPKPLRKKILHCLHSAHQGVDGMKARANDSVYWPEMNASIRNFRANCSFCTTIAPSQPREPITMTPSPEWPFQ